MYMYIYILIAEYIHVQHVIHDPLAHVCTVCVDIYVVDLISLSTAKLKTVKFPQQSLDQHLTNHWRPAVAIHTEAQCSSSMMIGHVTAGYCVHASCKSVIAWVWCFAKLKPR